MIDGGMELLVVSGYTGKVWSFGHGATGKLGHGWGDIRVNVIWD